MPRQEPTSPHDGHAVRQDKVRSGDRPTQGLIPLHFDHFGRIDHTDEQSATGGNRVIDSVQDLADAQCVDPQVKQVSSRPLVAIEDRRRW